MRKDLYVLFLFLGLPVPTGFFVQKNRLFSNFNKNKGKPLLSPIVPLTNTGLGNKKEAMEFQEKVIELKKINLNE